MTSADAQPGFLERWGLRYLRRFSSRVDGVTPERALTMGRNAIIIGGFVGFFFSGLVALFEIRYFQDPFEFHADWGLYLAIYLAAAIGFTAIETYFLIAYGLRAASAFAAATPHEKPQPSLRALCRAVIELPEPDIEPHGLDPELFTKRTNKLLWYIAYRLKYMGTNFFAKMLARRLMTRSGMRGFAPLVAAPVVAVWNMWVMHLVLSESKTRLVCRAVTDELDYGIAQLSPQGQNVIDGILANRFVAFGKYNHNLHVLLSERVKARHQKAMSLPNVAEVLEQKKQLSAAEQEYIEIATKLLFAYKRAYFNKRERILLMQLGVSRDDIAPITGNIRRLKTREVLGLLPDDYRAPAQ